MQRTSFSFHSTEPRADQGEGFEHMNGSTGGKKRWHDTIESDAKNTEIGGHEQTEGSSALSGMSSLYGDEAIAELKFMIEEEKLAGDIYDAFYNLYGKKIFDEIGVSEDQHFDALTDYAEKIGVDVDTFVFQPVGEFENPELQDLYDTLLAQGMESLTGALEVGVLIEEKDIVDIAAAADAVDGTPLADIYGNLLAGSYSHLDSFEALLA